MRSFLGRGAGAYGAERELSSLEMSRGLPDYAGGSRKAHITTNEIFFLRIRFGRS